MEENAEFDFETTRFNMVFGIRPTNLNESNMEVFASELESYMKVSADLLTWNFTAGIDVAESITITPLPIHKCNESDLLLMNQIEMSWIKQRLISELPDLFCFDDPQDYKLRGF